MLCRQQCILVCFPCTSQHRFNIPAIDILYFYPRNTDPALARAILARNFSAISPGVILQVRGWEVGFVQEVVMRVQVKVARCRGGT
jgi:hypothetical protein